MATRPAPELLAPAGSLTMLRSALLFGADAIYAGQPRYSLRVRNNEFARLDELAKAIDETRSAGRRFYLVSNILPHNSKVDTFLGDMAGVIALAPDALIMSDPGLIDLVRQHWPEVTIHLSVQANTVNWASVRFWRSLGITRVILSRELSLDEISEIRDRCPDCELEVFVHGALCIAYSGRCLLSGYFNHRDANQGSCTNACRWDYKLHQTVKPSEQTPNRDDDDFLLEESHRPGELMPIDEDEHGTYIMNSRDLRAIEHVARLVAIGVDSLKIEGRTKSDYYVARSVQAYRRAIDDAVAGRPFNPKLLSDLEALANRGYTDGFYQRHHDAETQNYLRGYSESAVGHYVGRIIGQDSVSRRLHIEVMNKFVKGDELDVILPTGNLRLPLTEMHSEHGLAIDVAPGHGHQVWISLPPEMVMPPLADGGQISGYVARLRT